MGFIPEMPKEAGEYHVEVRRESFYLRGEDSYDGPKDHALTIYPNPYPDGKQGSVEILIEDIPKLRACLDTVERVVRDGR